jgi:MFS transporter, ACS family, phthalate transporter
MIGSNDESRLYRKVVLRIIPFIFVCYVLNYVDRVNVSFAKLQFQGDLGLSDAAYGLGVGLFYVGYILFEVPSNLVLQKIGARKTITRIMCLWGLTSMAMAVVSTPLQFYLARILLGAAEAGFFPGIILYLTLWFPDRLRGRIMSFFILAIAVSGIVGGPTSGVIMQNLDGALGLKNWQWLFLIEGMLPVTMGITAFFVLKDSPRDASWLSDGEKDLLIGNLKVTGRPDSRSGTRAFLEALQRPMLWIATLGYFSVTWAGMVLNFWAPTIIRRAGVENLLHIGLLSAVPYTIGAAGMLALCYHSDHRLERHWHFFAAVAAAGCAAIAIAYSLWSSAALGRLPRGACDRLPVSRRLVLDDPDQLSVREGICRQHRFHQQRRPDRKPHRSCPVRLCLGPHRQSYPGRLPGRPCAVRRRKRGCKPQAFREIGSALALKRAGSPIFTVT